MQQEFKTGGSLGFTSGTTCTDTSLYKCTDGKVVYMVYIAAGDLFPKFPGGNGKSNATWYRVTLATDGGSRSFAAVTADLA